MTAFAAWFRIAYRNIFKNSRRSLFTIAAIAFGFASVNVFYGFTNYIYLSLEDAYIYLRAQGHITIFKRGFLEEGAIDPVRYLISEEEAASLRGILDDDPRVLVVTTQLSINGLASNGRASTVFVASGRIPSDVRRIRAYARSLDGTVQLFEGQPLEDELDYGVGLSAGLAELLGLSIGSEELIMVAPTVHGTMNALDGQVLQTFVPPSEDLGDKIAVLTLSYAQALYDTNNVDRFTVLLKDDADTDAVVASLRESLGEQGLDLEVKPWTELATFYVKTRQMFEVIFLFIFIIVFVIVVMSIINTMGMAVMERIREFGTLRALGLRRWGVMKLVAIESGMLTFFGSVFGLSITLLSWLAVEVTDPMWIPPQLAQEIPLHIRPEPGMMLASFVFLAVLAVFVSLLPARRAARLNIVEALGHV